VVIDDAHPEFDAARQAITTPATAERELTWRR